MNNKGQTLVIFVLILPIFFLLVGLVVESSRLMLIKEDYETAITQAIEYGIKHMDKENVKDNINNLLDKNIEGNKEVLISDTRIQIRVTNQMKGLFSKVFKDIYDIDITYIGYKENDKIIVKKR